MPGEAVSSSVLAGLVVAPLRPGIPASNLDSVFIFSYFLLFSSVPSMCQVLFCGSVLTTKDCKMVISLHYPLLSRIQDPKGN